MTLQRTPTPPDVELIRLHHRRTELDRAIRLLEEIRVIRLRRPPELAALLLRASSKIQRVA